MDWILRNIAVGSWEDASPANQSLLKSENIGTILNVRSDEDDIIKKKANEREEEFCLSHKMEYCHIPLRDFTTATDDQFISGVAFIARNVESGRKVLVHCGAGWGRSPSFVAAYLLFSKACKDTASAIDLVRNKRPGSFEGGDRIHIKRIKEFEKKLPKLRQQALERTRSAKCP